MTFKNENNNKDQNHVLANTNNTRPTTTTITKTSVHSYQIIKSLITINPEYSSLVYPLSKSEYELLKRFYKRERSSFTNNCKPR